MWAILMIAVIKNDDVCFCPAVKEWGFSAVDPKGSLKHYTLCAIQTHTQEPHLSTTKSPSAEGRKQTHRFMPNKNPLESLSLRNEDERTNVDDVWIHAPHPRLKMNPRTKRRRAGKQCNEMENLHNYVLIQGIFVILHVEFVYMNLHNP